MKQLVKILALVALVALVLSVSSGVFAAKKYNVNIKIYDKQGAEIEHFFHYGNKATLKGRVVGRHFKVRLCNDNKLEALSTIAFSKGYHYSVDFNSAIVTLVEYSINLDRFKNYNPENCYAGEIEQIKTETRHAVILGDDQPAEFLLPNEKTMTITVY